MVGIEPRSLRHRVYSPARVPALINHVPIWQGMKGSNLLVAGSKPVAFSLRQSPTVSTGSLHNVYFVVSDFLLCYSPRHQPRESNHTGFHRIWCGQRDSNSQERLGRTPCYQLHHARKIRLGYSPPRSHTTYAQRLSIVVTTLVSSFVGMCRHLWCRQQESNPRPSAYKAVALPAELYRHIGKLTLSRKLSNALSLLSALASCED